MLQCIFLQDNRINCCCLKQVTASLEHKKHFIIRVGYLGCFKILKKNWNVFEDAIDYASCIMHLCNISQDNRI